MRKTKSFSYDEQDDKEVIDHLGKMSNASAYIVNLIRADMNKKSSFSDVQKREIFNIIQQYINENEIVLTKTNDEVDSEVLNALDQFDGM